MPSNPQLQNMAFNVLRAPMHGRGRVAYILYAVELWFSLSLGASVGRLGGLSSIFHGISNGFDGARGSSHSKAFI